VSQKKNKRRWSTQERALISNSLSDGITLSEINELVPNRSEIAVISEVNKKNGYSIRTMDDGTRRFFTGVKTRNRGKKEKSIDVISDQTFTSIEKNVDNNQQTSIVPKKVLDTGKELRLMALDLLFRENLIIANQSVKQAAKLLSQFKKEVSA
jgi:hypothetical protein